MEKQINRVGLSWVYEQIKGDLINIYNLLNTCTPEDIEHKFKDIDYKLCHIAKSFFLLDISGGVFFTNEFRLSLKYLVHNNSQDQDANKIIAVADNIEKILNYIEDIIQGYGDLPIYYVDTIDELRVLRDEVCFSQCSYIVNSVKQHNISDFPAEYDPAQREAIKNSLLNIKNNLNNNDQVLRSTTVLKERFAGTQHYLLWDLIEAYYNLRKNYNYASTYVINSTVKTIVSDYYNIIDGLGFERIAKNIPDWIATLAFSVLFSNYYNILSKTTRQNISKMLIVNHKKTLSNYMSFMHRMIDSDSWILLLDIASELDFAINNLQDAQGKKRIDINWLLELMQKHIDSCVLTGTYEPLEHYYEAVHEITQYTITGGFISSSDLEIIENCIVKLTQNVEQTVHAAKIEDTQQDDVYNILADSSEAQVNQDAQKELLKYQLDELNNISSEILNNPNLTNGSVVNQFEQIKNIFKIISFSSGEGIINLYLNKLASTQQLGAHSNGVLSESLKQNIIVFIKYLAEIITAVSKNKDYNLHIKSIRNLINSLEVASINNNFINNTESLDEAEALQPNVEQAPQVQGGSLQQIFFEEYEEIHENINLLFSNWSSNYQNQSIIESLQREMHTLKGAARMVGFNIISDWVHHIETLLEQCMQNISSISGDHINKITLASNKILELVESYKKNITPKVPDLITLSFMSSGISGFNSSSPSLSLASLLKDSKTAGNNQNNLAANNSQDKSPLPLRQSVRISKEELDDLLDSSCELTIGQHQLVQQNNYFDYITGKLNNTADILTSGALKGKDIKSVVQDLKSVIKQIQEVKANYYNIIDTADKNVSEIFNKLVNFRMIPLSAIRDRLDCLVNSISQELGKKIDFTIEKSEGSIDRVILEQITPSLEHLIRNAIDHGIERTADRLANNKNPYGKINLNMYTDEQSVIIELTDDGSGIDIKSIEQRAKKLGIISESTIVTSDDILPIITSPKFSTADGVSQISGRGIGLNVVKDTISNLCGRLELESLPNQGTKFIISLPYSLAKQSLLFVKLADLYYAIPSLIIDQVVTINNTELSFKNNALYYNNFEVYRLYDLLNLDQEQVSKAYLDYSNQKIHNIIIINYKNHKIGLIIDSVYEARESVVRPLAPQLRKLIEFMGGTIYQDGRVVLILDIINILNNYLLNRDNIEYIVKQNNINTIDSISEDFDSLECVEPVEERNARANGKDNIIDEPILLDGESLSGQAHSYSPASESIVDKEIVLDDGNKKNVLVVEDSATVRHAISTYLNTAEFNILTAIDGIDALKKLDIFKPDIILLDIFMPKMNGLEFLRQIRKTEDYKHTPVIIMTSRDEKSYKDIAMQLNVDVYLKKPYNKSRLINAINYVFE